MRGQPGHRRRPHRRPRRQAPRRPRPLRPGRGGAAAGHGRGPPRPDLRHPGRRGRRGVRGPRADGGVAPGPVGEPARQRPLPRDQPQRAHASSPSCRTASGATSATSTCPPATAPPATRRTSACSSAARLADGRPEPPPDGRWSSTWPSRRRATSSSSTSCSTSWPRAPASSPTPPSCPPACSTSTASTSSASSPASPSGTGARSGATTTSPSWAASAWPCRPPPPTASCAGWSGTTTTSAASSRRWSRSPSGSRPPTAAAGGGRRVAPLPPVDGRLPGHPLPRRPGLRQPLLRGPAQAARPHRPPLPAGPGRPVGRGLGQLRRRLLPAQPRPPPGRQPARPRAAGRPGGPHRRAVRRGARPRLPRPPAGGPGRAGGDVRRRPHRHRGRAWPRPAAGGDDRLVGLVEAMAVGSRGRAAGPGRRGPGAAGGQDAEAGTRRALDAMVRLLATDSPDAWNVALKTAATRPGPAASTSSAGRRPTSGRPCARRPASTPTSSGGPTTPTACPCGCYADLAPTVTITGQILHKKDRLVLDFLAGLSIMVYVNHPDRPEVVAQTAALWYELLKNRLKLHLLNREGVRQGGHARWWPRCTPSACSTRPCSAGSRTRGEFFAADRDGHRAGWSPSSTRPPTSPGRGDDLAALLQSPLALSRMVGGDGARPSTPSTTRPAPTPSSGSCSGASTTPAGGGRCGPTRCSIEKAPAAWDAAAGGPHPHVRGGEPGRLPGRRRRHPGAVRHRPAPPGPGLRQAGRAHDVLRRRSWPAADDPPCSTGSSGAWRRSASTTPRRCCETLRDVGAATCSDPALEDSLATTLATIRVLHADTVDLFLREVGAPDRLRRLVAERGDIELVRRYVVWIGLLQQRRPPGPVPPQDAGRACWP